MYVSEALARFARSRIMLHVHYFILSVHLGGGLPPPPPQYQKAGYATVTYYTV